MRARQMIGILLLMQAAFRSWRMAAALPAASPVALAGGVLATFAFDGVSRSDRSQVSPPRS
jgi:predicted exporter